MLDLGPASSALDSASQLLAGGASNPAASTTPTDQPPFIRGIHIDTDDADAGGSTAPNLLNERDLHHLLEFIHFGYVHTSYSNFFTHPSYKDSVKDENIVDGSKPRAIQFRSALEREAILLSVFMECTQTVLQDRADSQGALGTALNAIGSLTGASGGGSGQTAPSDLNAPIQQVVAAIKPALVESITYPNTHQAGRDMHLARRVYRALLLQIAGEQPTSGAGGSLGSALTSVSSGLSGVSGPIGDVISFAQGVAFKPQEIKTRFFVKVAIQQEPQIETACNAMTLQALTDLINPVFSVWFGGPTKAATWDSAPASPLSPTTGLLGKIINPAADAVTSARDKTVAAANSVKSFFEVPAPDPPPPGIPFLDQVFGVTPPPKSHADPVPMAMGALAVQAFIDALQKKSPLNSFCEGVISAVFAVTLDFIHGTYAALLARSAQEPITDDTLYAAAQSEIQIGSRLLALAMDKVTFIQQAEQFSANLPMGYNVGVGQLLDKGADKINDLVTNTVGPLMDDALKLAMANLAQKLDLARTDGNSNNCLTMEWYLGRLPWVEATLFCDLFFPFWNALLQCVMNVVNPAAASVIKTIVGAANTAKSAVDSARNDVAKANALQTAATNTMNQAGQGVNMLNPGQVENLGSGYGSAMKATASKITGPTADRGAFTVPVTGRSSTGTGAEVPETPDYEQVVPNHEWGGASDPPTDSTKDASQSSTDASQSSAGATSNAKSN